jgi:hypothetical protein
MVSSHRVDLTACQIKRLIPQRLHAQRVAEIGGDDRRRIRRLWLRA